MRDRPIILMDFDGVIADTFGIACVVARKLCVYLDEREYRKQFEHNIFHSRELINAKDHGDQCDHDLDWVSEYRPHFHAHAKPFPGIPEMMRELSTSYRIIIVSSAHGELVHHFLDKYDLMDTVEEVMGHDAGALKSEKFKLIFGKYDIVPAQTVFVTDTLGDVNEASEVGVESIGVEWGFQDRATLERGKPFRIIGKVADLPAVISDYFALAPVAA